MTKIVNKYKEKYDIYIGRGSLFGNPFTHIKDKQTKAEYIVDTREEAIHRYMKYFIDRIKTDEIFKKEVIKLKGKTLGCFCKPKSCHGDIIVYYLDNYVD